MIETLIGGAAALAAAGLGGWALWKMYENREERYRITGNLPSGGEPGQPVPYKVILLWKPRFKAPEHEVPIPATFFLSGGSSQLEFEPRQVETTLGDETARGTITGRKEGVFEYTVTAYLPGGGDIVAQEKWLSFDVIDWVDEPKPGEGLEEDGR